MLAAFLTTLLFSISGVTAMRTTRYLSSVEANLGRLLLATALLALYGHTLGAGIGGPAFGWFLMSGVVGFGVGDLALYQAYPRLGSRLVILIVHCVASPLAAAVEWAWLAVPVSPSEAGASLLILAGVALALYPGRAVPDAMPNPARVRGILFALVAAAGQGFGAVLSRRAYEAARIAGVTMDGISAAYQRILAGLLVAILAWVWSCRRARRRPPGPDTPERPRGAASGWRVAAPWLLVNALAGPGLGVSCFQWALSERGTGVVLPIVALTPLVIIPFSMWFEAERPNRRSLAGGVLAVTGAVIHALGH